MNVTLEFAATVLQNGYALMLICVGAVGIASVRPELSVLYSLDLDRLPSDAAATFANQYRFLKGMEFGAGAYCFLHRHAILRGGRETDLFLIIVGAGVVARTWSWLVEGTPSLLFVTFLMLETLVFIVIFVYARLRHDHA